ncbi:MAG: hypothetical protein KF696_09830 [Planctomycetes bacterium]|nr:hypothetical protein [Planctomycetota bacterium]MCW8136156.1 hypothetical protein [Planctomycetota bacterium]
MVQPATGGEVPDTSTRRIHTTPGHKTAMLLHEKYMRRRGLIQSFAESLQWGEAATPAAIAGLREVGVSEDEIKSLVAQHSQ